MTTPLPQQDAAATAAEDIVPTQDGVDDSRAWTKPVISEENKARQREQQQVGYGEVGFNPMARDPDTGELLHPWPPKD